MQAFMVSEIKDEWLKFEVTTQRYACLQLFRADDNFEIEVKNRRFYLLNF